MKKQDDEYHLENYVDCNNHYKITQFMLVVVYELLRYAIRSNFTRL
jgi:hypothetical protein